MSVCAAFMFFTAVLAFSLRMLLVWRNRSLDNKHGKKTVSDSSLQGVENYGPEFRYVL